MHSHRLQYIALQQSQADVFTGLSDLTVLHITELNPSRSKPTDSSASKHSTTS